MNSIVKAALITVTGITSLGVFCQETQAVPIPITGNITFAGSVTLDSPSAGTATTVTAWHGLGAGGLPQVQSRDGTFSGFVTAGDATTFAFPWTFNSGAVSNFWTVDGFRFDLTASAVSSQGGSLGSGHVAVDGFGTISGNGFAPTAGTWHFTTQDPAADSLFSFSAATGTVPEGGSTVALFGIALVGFEGLRRLFRMRKA